MDPGDTEAIFNSFFLHNPIPMWIYDVQTLAFLEVNRAAVQHYGYSREEFCTMTLADIRPAEDVPRLHESVARIREGLNRAGTWRHILKNGKTIYVEVTSHTLEYQGRNAKLVSAVDITNLVEIRNAYEKSEERYRTVSELTSDYAYAFRIAEDGTITNEWATGALKKITGYTWEELQALGGWEHLIHPEDRRTALDQLEALLAGKAQTAEYRITTKNGQVHWMRDYARPQRDSTGSRTVYIYGAVSDVTAQRTAQDSLKQSFETLHTILDSVDATIYVADLETYEILFMNRTMKESFGYGLEGKRCYNVFRGLGEPCPLCTNPKLTDQDGNPTGVIVWEGRNPITNRWYLNYDRAVRWTDNRLVRLQIASDITDLKSAEENTKKLERQLQQAQKMEAIGNLAGGIAHDFNNILTSIIGYTEFAISEVAGEGEVKKNLREVLLAGYRAKNLVRQILTFSRQTEHNMEPIEVTSIVREAANLLRSTIPTTIAINVDSRASQSTILGDATQIHQVIINLCTNSAHAMEDRGGKVDILLEDLRVGAGDSIGGSQLEPGDYLKISAIDTGCGIAAEVVDHIFEPFFTTKAKGKGTGMGLAVVHGIVESHRGYIDVESEPGKGTTVRLYFPLIEQARLKKKPASVKVSRKGHETVLLVDDEPQIVALLQKQLNSAGYQVYAFESSPEAFSHFKENPQQYDIVITDMTMPDMTGKHLAAELKAVRSDIPIILSTGYNEEVSEDTAEGSVVDAILLKPTGREDLLRTLRQLLD